MSRVCFLEINSLLRNRGIKFIKDLDESLSEEFLRKNYRQAIKNLPRPDIISIFEDDDEFQDFFVFEKNDKPKIKGDLVVVYSKFSVDSDVSEMIDYEEELRNEFLMYEPLFKVHCYNLFLKESIEDLILSLKGKPFFVFFLNNNSFSDIKDLIVFFSRNNGVLYSEKKFKSKKIKFFEFERKAFLVSEKQGKF